MIGAMKSSIYSLFLGGLIKAVLFLIRETRSVWRLFRLVLLFGRGLWTVGVHFPRWDEPQRRRVKQAWSSRLLSCLGVCLPRQGLSLPEGALIVSNHISWLDIFVINALTPTHFVCKDEVRDWPLIGWLVEQTDTVFIARGSRVAAARTAREIRARLEADERVVVFPEGTTTCGEKLLPFRTALFQAAVESESPVQPIALRYTNRTGERSEAPAYAGETSFWECLRGIVCEPALFVELQTLDVLSGLERREFAARAEAAIAQALGLTCPGQTPMRASSPVIEAEAAFVEA